LFDHTVIVLWEELPQGRTVLDRGYERRRECSLLNRRRPALH
jgi:hypothetical protein